MSGSGDPARDEPERRRWLPLLLAAVLVVVGSVVVAVVDHHPPLHCASAVRAHSPLAPPSRFADDEHLTKLAGAVEAMGAPFGPVRAGVGFNYDQWLHLYGLATGVLAFTKNNAAMTLLDGTSLEARWSLEPATKRIAWDASATRLALLDLDAEHGVRVGSYDLRTGREKWCVALAERHRDGQPVSTAFLDDGDLLVALPAGDGLAVTRISPTGTVHRLHGLAGVGRADFLAPVGGDRFLAGGEEAFRLDDAAGQSPSGGFGLFALSDGRPVEGPTSASDGLHVVGLDADAVVVLRKRGGQIHLEELTFDGHRRWGRVVPAGTDVSMRGSVVLVRSRTQLAAYTARTGRLLWRRPVPTDRTYFPYGFSLDQAPPLDASHVLLPTTTSLQVLDVTTGEHHDFPLPTDGVSTTYWPYQLLVTDALIGVVTNTGGVLASRQP